MATATYSVERFPATLTLDRARAIENGLPVSALRALLAGGTVRLTDLVDVVAKRRTLDRRLAEDDVLTTEESDRLARFGEVLALATHVIGGRAEAMEWLRTPKRRLDGARPLELMRTFVGTELVINFLNLARHGMLA